MSTPFHPQGNAKCERMVKVVGNLISAFCTAYESWDKHLPVLTMAYRATVHDVTGFTPNMIMTGREILLPIDVMIGNLNEGEKQYQADYVQSVQNRRRRVFKMLDNNSRLKLSGKRDITI